MVGEHRRSLRAGRRALHALGEAVAVEDVVAERERHRVARDERPTDQERLREPFGPGLHGPVDRQPEPLPGTEQATERLLIVRGGDDQDLADTRQHEAGERVVDQRLVVDRQQLLAHREGQRVEPRAGAAGEDDPLHRCDDLVTTPDPRRETVSASSAAARVNTASSMGRVSRPVNVFCWLGW